MTGLCGQRCATSATTVTACVLPPGHDPALHEDGAGVSWGGGKVHVTLSADVTRLAAAFDRLTRTVTRQMDAYVSALGKRFAHDQHSPRPLCIDGHAYRRRRNARRRRR